MPESLPNPALPLATPVDSAADPELSRFTAALVRGEEAVWANFHDRFRPRLLAYLARTWHGEPASLDDLLQETLLRAVRHMRVFDEEASLWSWLTVLARSAVADHGRRRARWWRFLERWRMESELRALPTAPDQHREQLDNALAHLDAEARALLVAKYFQRRSVRDLATEHLITEKAIEGRLSRARQKLAALLHRSQPPQ